MYQIEKPKRRFEYTIDGVVHSDTTPEYVDSLELNSEQKAEVVRLITKFHNQLAYYERKWRNRRLAETDWMMVPDATFGGEPLSGSDKLDEIIEYRRTLREYNLTTDDRPAKPAWLT